MLESLVPHLLNLKEAARRVPFARERQWLLGNEVERSEAAGAAAVARCLLPHALCHGDGNCDDCGYGRAALGADDHRVRGPERAQELEQRRHVFAFQHSLA